MERQSIMERYTVKFRDPHEEADLAFLVPLTRTSTMSTLMNEARRRAAKRLPCLAEGDLIPHYGGEEGPILDGDDVLGDVIPDPKTEVIFVANCLEPLPNIADELSVSQASSNLVGSGCKGLKIRVITPALAKKHDSTKTIPLLEGGTPIADSTTLYELKIRIAQSLCCPVENLPAPQSYQECNCAFARQILNRGIWKKIDCATHTGSAAPGQDLTYCKYDSPSTQSLMSNVCAICSDTILNHQARESISPDQLGDGCHKIFVRTDTACKHVLHSRCLQSHKTWNCPSSCQTERLDMSNETETSDKCSSRFIVVYGKSKVESINVESCSKRSMLEALHSKFGSDIEEVKSVEFHRGVYEPEKDQYVIMPVVSICSLHRHIDIPDERRKPTQPANPATDREGSIDSHSYKDLDLHTSEGHIVMTTPCLTISQVNFSDCTIGGVLDIYAVERVVDNPTVMKAGKDGIFTLADYWRIPTGQSERGMAAFLSSLRVFTDLVNAKKMGQTTQDQVLHLIHVLTKFPPAIRTMFILMQGKSPRPAECAALVQALFEVLKDTIPLEIIEGDENRSLEGSRLLLGYLLATAKAQRGPEEQLTPYLHSFRTIDLLNAETRQPIANPVETSIGLVEEGYYEAHKEGGILSWSNGEEPMEARSIDHQTRRLTLICGGLESEVTVLDWGFLDTLLPGNNLHLSFERHPVLPDMNSLAVYCERNGLAVILPSALPSSQAPALTLDRDCLQAVYVGRQPCGEPGKDITIFRPTKAMEENVDVAIITQIIAPILKARENEKCAIFDSCGRALKGKERTPDEILIFCIDCSSSMNAACDFAEFENTDEDEDEVDDDDIDEYDGWEDEYEYCYEDEDEGDDDDVFQRNLPDDDQESEETLTDEDIFGLITLSETKRLLLDNESFDDMLAIIRQAGRHQRLRAFLILKQLVLTYQRELAHNIESLDLLMKNSTRRHRARKCSKHEHRISWLELAIEGISNHKEALVDFMKSSARRSNVGSRDWIWKSGEAIPNRPSHLHLSAQDVSKLFCIPPEFLCPIQHEVFEDPVITSDGFTYERKSIERWFQIHWSSPSTGLGLRDTALKHNGVLADRIKRWIAGEPFNERQSNLPKRRRLTRPSTALCIEVHFVNPLTSFIRRVPRLLSVEDLYKVAFQAMKGHHFSFDLRHDGNILHACPESIQERGLTDKSTVYIDLTESHKSVISDKNKKAGTKVESEDLALVKVYQGKHDDDHLFSFWIPRNTKQSLASLIFRFWRFDAEYQFQSEDYDVEFWINMRYVGDGQKCGTRCEHWETLGSLLTPRNATGILEDEVFLEKESADTVIDLISSDEKILVLKISLYQYVPRSKNLELKAERARNFSRLGVSKQIFDSFINRTLAYDFSVHIGLITFNSTVHISQEITSAIENFRQSLDSMSAVGDTALWDAIALADDQLSQYGQKYPNARKRIICLSDGADTKSTKRSHEVSLSIVQRKVVVDSFCLGYEDNKELRTVSHVSGGYKFCPETLEQAMAICEMEPVLSQLERPPIRRKSLSPFNPRRTFENATSNATPDVVTRDVYPARKEHENLKDSFVKVSSLAQSGRQSTTAPNSASGAPKSSSTRSARLLSELKNVSANPHPYYEVFVSERNMGFWKVLMRGPSESDYAEGVFLLYLHMEDDYPAFPPKGRFCTPIFHPNINRHGRICHSILDRNWTVDTTNVQILNTIYSLLLVPEFSDPINTVVTLNYHWDQVAFQDEVKKHIQKHAAKSMDTLRTMVLEASI